MGEDKKSSRICEWGGDEQTRDICRAMTRGKKINLFCNWRPGNNVQEGGVFLHGVCAVCSTDLQLYIPLVLPCFIDQGPWAVARVY